MKYKMLLVVLFMSLSCLNAMDGSAAGGGGGGGGEAPSAGTCDITKEQIQEQIDLYSQEEACCELDFTPCGCSSRCHKRWGNPLAESNAETVMGRGTVEGKKLMLVLLEQLIFLEIKKGKDAFRQHGSSIEGFVESVISAQSDTDESVKEKADQVKEKVKTKFDQIRRIFPKHWRLGDETFVEFNSYEKFCEMLGLPIVVPPDPTA